MISENTETAHVEGPPWKIVGRFPTFNEADQKRLELAMEEDLQVKVHWQGSVSNRYFAVKTRTDPAATLEEDRRLQREAKKRRKAKLSKKRRKK
jgi:hypothetical protein|tara:strand:+ start:6102 stop:6383 length:282 start_codon:yes stop_codon:yes gene_type:complete